MGLNNYFWQNEELVEVLLRVMEVFFTTPQSTFVIQGDVRNQHLYIIGDGFVDVQKKYTNA